MGYIFSNHARLDSDYDQDRIALQALKASRFKYNIYQGYRVSSPFSWIYSEKIDWVTGANVPAGIDETILRVKEKIQRGEALGFDAEVQALWDMVEARKKVGHK